ncbi:hypothetical protein [Aureimonas psammosilenae]|nr:hypothetical protein [Aureimonas psammosilenae]
MPIVTWVAPALALAAATVIALGLAHRFWETTLWPSHLNDEE